MKGHRFAVVLAVVLTLAVGLLNTATTRIDGQPTPGDPDQPAHQAGVGVGALPWITGW